MRCAALLVLVLLLAATARADEGDLLLEAGDVRVGSRLEPTSDVVVGQRVSLHLDLKTVTWFTGGATLPNPEIEGAIVRRFGNQAVNASETIDGEAYATQTWTWWVYPRRPGRFEVPALDVVVRTVDDERQKVEVRARTKPITFTASLAPDASGDAVLATHGFTLEQALDPEPRALRVGDAVRRTLTMRVADVPGMLIPPVSYEAPDGVRPYPDAPRVEDLYDRGSLEGLRVESTSYLLEREGSYELPEVRVRWWSLETQTWQEAVAAAVTLEVAPNPELASSAATAEEGETPSPSPGSPLPWITGGLLAAVAIFLVVRRVAPRVRAYAVREHERRQASESAYFERFRAACATNDPAASRRALRAWLDRALAPSVTLQAFVDRANDPALTREVATLENRLYGSSAPEAWSGSALARAVEHARRRMHEPPSPTAARALNPRGVSTGP